MKETKGRADGGEVNRLIKEKLGAADVAPRGSRVGVTSSAYQHFVTSCYKVLS